MSKKILILLGIFIFSLTYFTLAEELTSGDFELFKALRVEESTLNEYRDQTFELSFPNEQKPQDCEAPYILLKSRTIDPCDSPTLNIREGQAHTYLLVQFIDVLTEEQQEQLNDLEIYTSYYIPHNAWYLSIPTNNIAELQDLDFVTYVTTIEREDKLSPNLALLKPDEEGNVFIQFVSFLDVTEQDVQTTFKEYGTILAHDSDIYVAYLSQQRLEDLADEPIITWIEPARFPQGTHNDAILQEMVFSDPSIYTTYEGNNLVVGMWDVGFPDNAHPDLNGRIIVGETSGIAGHSTHVAGTIMGDGTDSAAKGGAPLQWRGVADKTSIASYDFFFSLGTISLQQETNDAIMVHNILASHNSWGWCIGNPALECGILTGNTCMLHGDYDLYSREYDKIVRGSQGARIPVVFSAGNERDDGDCPPYPFFQLNGPGATSKNAVVVGSLNATTPAGGPFPLSWYSSWGPTDDGRIKPDIMSYGCQEGTDFGVTSTMINSAYAVMCGTSMAAPAVTGSLVMLYEKYQQVFGVAPWPSTLKALILNQNVNKPRYDIGYQLYTIDTTLDAVDPMFIRERTLNQGQTHNYYIMNNPSTQSVAFPQVMRTTLVWDDVEGQPFAAVTLVNNLDMIMQYPNGSLVRPIVLNPVTPGVTGIQGVDNRNNVEKIFINPEGNEPPEGIYTITVTGTSIPQGPQDYSLTSTYEILEECTSTPTNKCVVGNNLLLQPGTYNLEDGIIIGRDGVTLDCQGAEIVGTGNNIGITVEGLDGITIRNCIVKNYATGISLHPLEDITSGSMMTATSNVFLDNNELSLNTVNGLKLMSTQIITASNNIIINNVANGIHIEDSLTQNFDRNEVCSNPTDFNLVGTVAGNTGINNVCDTPTTWNDIGMTGCTFTCQQTPQLVLQGTPTAGSQILFNMYSPGNAGKNYILGFAWGTMPGIILGPGQVIPLNLDDLFFLMFNSGALLGLNNYIGVLDSTAQATATWDLPIALQGVTGLTANYAYVTLDPNLPPGPQQVTSISQAWNFTLV